MKTRTPHLATFRPAFTLVELLVVAAIVAVATALTLPSIAQARSAARDAQCSNRLKQIGLAMHNYHDVYNCFPPGWVSRDWSGPGHPSTGWSSSILPFIELANLYSSLNMNGSVYEPARDTPAGRATALKLVTAGKSLYPGLEVFRCSAEPETETNPLRGNFGMSAFSGNYGTEPIARWSDTEGFPGQPSSYWRTRTPASPSGASRQLTGPDGIFSVNSRVGFRDITDGTSNTFLVGERSVIGKGGLWPGPRSNYHESDVVSDASYASGLNLSDTGFSSRHPDGIHFVLCDGSVRFIRPDITSTPEGAILQHLASRNDGNVVGEF